MIHSVARFSLGAPPLFTHTRELIVARDVDLRVPLGRSPRAETMRGGCNHGDLAWTFVYDPPHRESTRQGWTDAFETMFVYS